MKSQWEIHNGVRYFHFNLSDFGTDDMGLMKECDEADAIVMTEPLNSVLLLNDVRNSIGSLEVVKHLQLSAERSSPYVLKAAVVGVTGSTRLVLDLVNRFSKKPILAFDNLETAKNWLVDK